MFYGFDLNFNGCTDFSQIEGLGFMLNLGFLMFPILKLIIDLNLRIKVDHVYKKKKK